MNFKNYFTKLESNDEGNENIASFVNALSGESKDDAKTATYDADGVALGADVEEKIVVINSMRNLGGSLCRLENKIAALVGMGSNPTGVLITDDIVCQHEKEKKLQVSRSFKNVNQMKNARLSRVFQRECMMPQTSF